MTTAPRLISRVVGLLALALAAATCSDGPAAPAESGAGSAARIALTPSFSASAARSYAALTQLGFDITGARVRLTASDGRIVVDTVLPFPTAQDTLRLDLSVSVRGIEESFTALVELRDASGLVLFAGAPVLAALRRAARKSAFRAPVHIEVPGDAAIAR